MNKPNPLLDGVDPEDLDSGIALISDALAYLEETAGNLNNALTRGGGEIHYSLRGVSGQEVLFSLLRQSLDQCVDIMHGK